MGPWDSTVDFRLRHAGFRIVQAVNGHAGTFRQDQVHGGGTQPFSTRACRDSKGCVMGLRARQAPAHGGLARLDSQPVAKKNTLETDARPFRLPSEYVRAGNKSPIGAYLLVAKSVNCDTSGWDVPGRARPAAVRKAFMELRLNCGSSPPRPGHDGSAARKTPTTRRRGRVPFFVWCTGSYAIGGGCADGGW